MNFRMKHILVMSISICLVLTLLASGCAPAPPVTTSTPPSAPAPPFTVDLSFPDGAPPLNQEAELICTVKSNTYTTDINVEINLPDGFELVSGNLSWFTDRLTSDEDEKEAIKAVIKSVKIGNWTIEALISVGPESAWKYHEGIGNYPIYVSVFEDSAEWGIYPPWGKKGFVPVAPVPADPSFIRVKVDLSISEAPALNVPAELTCIVSSERDVPNTTAQIILPDGAQL